MNLKAVIPLVLAVALGLVAAVMVRNAMLHKNEVAGAPSNLVAVVVAKQDVDPGRALSKDDLRVSKMPADLAPGKVFSDPSLLVGRVVINPLIKGETILETLLAPNGTGSGLQSLVPPGMRAITLEVTEYTGVGGMLTPGSRIDVIGVVSNEKHEQVARTILQNLKVQAVGHTITNAPPAEGQPAPPPSNAITLLCTPRQAQVLQLATLTSRPWFVLRSGRDGQELPVEGTTLAQLRGDDSDDAMASDLSPRPTVPADSFTVNNLNTVAPTTDAPPSVSKRIIQIIRGGNESQVTFTIAIPRGQTADVDKSPEINQ